MFLKQQKVAYFLLNLQGVKELLIDHFRENNLCYSHFQGMQFNMHCSNAN